MPIIVESTEGFYIQSDPHFRFKRYAFFKKTMGWTRLLLEDLIRSQLVR